MHATNTRDLRIAMVHLGRWRWDETRKIIQSLKLGHLEGYGWLSSTFVVFGPPATMLCFEYQMTRIARRHKPEHKFTFPAVMLLVLAFPAYAQNDDGSMGAPNSPAGQLNHDTGDLGSGGMDQSNGYPGFNDRYVSAPNEPGIFSGVGLETLHFGRDGSLTFTHEIDFDTGRSLSQPSGSMTTNGTLSGPV